MAAKGALKPDHLIWSEGMAKWVPAQNVEGIFTFASPPPPPPPNEYSTSQPPPPPPPMQEGDVKSQRQTEKQQEQQEGAQQQQPADKSDSEQTSRSTVNTTPLKKKSPSQIDGTQSSAASSSYSKSSATLMEKIKKSSGSYIILAIIGIILLLGGGIVLWSDGFQTSSLTNNEVGVIDDRELSPEQEPGNEITSPQEQQEEVSPTEEPHEPEESSPPDYDQVSEVIAEDIRSAGHVQDFELAPVEELKADDEAFFEKYTAEEIYVYDYEKTGSIIEVDVGWPYSELFATYTLEWEDDRWLIKNITTYD